jgi:hypothetical protein
MELVVVVVGGFVSEGDPAPVTTPPWKITDVAGRFNSRRTNNASAFGVAARPARVTTPNIAAAALEAITALCGSGSECIDQHSAVVI